MMKAKRFIRVNTVVYPAHVWNEFMGSDYIPPEPRSVQEIRNSQMVVSIDGKPHLLLAPLGYAFNKWLNATSEGRYEAKVSSPRDRVAEFVEIDRQYMSERELLLSER